MFYRNIVKYIPMIFILASITLWFGYAENRRDPFFRYRDFEKKALHITKPEKVQHYGAEEALIRAKLSFELSKKERAILAGLHWILGLVDEDIAFATLFPDLMLFLDKMTASQDRIHQKEVVNLIIKTSFARAAKQLDTLFSNQDMSRWRFIGLFPILLRHPEFQDEYFSFYQKKWPDLEKKFYVKDFDINKAIKEDKYQALFDYLVWPSFLHYYLVEVKKSPLTVPEDLFSSYLQAFEKFDYKEYAISQPEFRNLGYLATHVILALTNYGQAPIQDSINTQKVKKYIESSFEKTRLLGDFDLFAEYIQSLKILHPEGDARIPDLENFLYDLQRPDGSWGSERDFSTHPYTAIHPGGAALMALNQKHLKIGESRIRNEPE